MPTRVCVVDIMTSRAPREWQRAKLGSIFSERKEIVSDYDYPPLSVSKDGIVPQMEGVAKTDNTDNRKRVCAGDVVINSRSDRRGSSGLSQLDGSVSIICTVLKPAYGYPRFWHYLIRSSAFQEEFYRNGHGIVDDLWTTRFSDAKGILLAVPDDEYQAAVVDFLDRHTAEADALAAKYERLIELLEEKRAALITQATTKGLDHGVSMKDSGLEWIGEIPRNWEIVPFRYCGRVSEGLVDPREAAHRNEILIAPNHVEANSGRILWLETAAEQGADSSKYQVKKGDIIYSKIRPALNKVSIAPLDCLCSADMYPITPTARVTPTFLLYSMLSAWFVSVATEMSMRVKMPKINRKDLATIKMIVPPLETQRLITEHIRKEASALESLCQQSARAISLVKEHRSALITAAVTGEINVLTYKPTALELA